jgi:hypothetical protein
MLLKMTCGRAQKLMPLYAGGDLAGRVARRAAAHVEGCDACRRLAAEFAETREWARAAAEPPQFGAEFYEALRSGVLEEIRRGARPRGPRRAAFFDALGGRRLAYATSFALLLVACALAFNYYSRRATDATDAPPSPLAKRPADARQADVRQADVLKADVLQAATPEPAFASRRHELRPAPPRAVNEPRRTHPRPEARPRVELAGGSVRQTPGASRDAPGGGAGRELNAGPSVEPAPRQVASAAAGPAGPGEVARIEMQTADPNIRIIWLAPQEAPAPAPQR